MLIDILQCPNCTKSELIASAVSIQCVSCSSVFQVRDGVPYFLPRVSEEDEFKKKMRSFWGGGWRKRGNDDAHTSSRDEFLLELGTMRLMMELLESDHAKEMASLSLEGKRVLEIGCGSGNSSIMFALHGAQVVALDLTDSAVAITHNKFKLLGINGLAVQADAEHLPFREEIFDVVYSNGVLHHTPNIEAAVKHIHRVLKPGGHAVIMLYARWSFVYFVSLLFVQGVLLGAIWRYGFKNWLGNITEKKWHTNTKELNPLTRVYSAREMKKLFKNFTVLSIRKSGFNWADIFPGIYRVISRHKFRVGDVAVVVPDPLERILGRWAGFGLTIHFQKSE